MSKMTFDEHLECGTALQEAFDLIVNLGCVLSEACGVTHQAYTANWKAHEALRETKIEMDGVIFKEYPSNPTALNAQVYLGGKQVDNEVSQLCTGAKSYGSLLQNSVYLLSCFCEKIRGRYGSSHSTFKAFQRAEIALQDLKLETNYPTFSREVGGLMDKEIGIDASERGIYSSLCCKTVQ